MLAAPFKVVVDANVLYPFTLRDTLLRAAAAGYFQLYWSDQILEETTRNLVRNGIVTDAQAVRLRTALTSAFPEATSPASNRSFQACSTTRRTGTSLRPRSRLERKSS